MSDHPRDVLYLEIEAERLSQDAKWGEQNYPDGTGGDSWEAEADAARAACEQAFAAGHGTWRHILEEEVAEAFAEPGWSIALREELIQVAAVAVSWIEALDRRGYNNGSSA